MLDLMPKPFLPIRVICATKNSVEDFNNTNTGKSLIALCKTTDAELKVYPNNSRGLPELYNQAIDESLFSPAILVFIHDDVLVTDFFWGNRVRQGLERFDFVGVVGNKRRLPNQPGWIISNINGTIDNFSNLSGAIGQGDQFPPAKIDYFGDSLQECKLMDGVFLAAKSETLILYGLKFDAIFKFHFYDLDICRSMESRELKMGTIDLSIIHQSYGRLTGEWFDSYQMYLNKWHL